MTETKKYEISSKDKLIAVYMLIGFIIQVFMLFFFSNWAKLDIIMYLGFLSIAISAILFLLSNILKKEGGMEEGKGFVTTKLVDTGIYGIIRHPIYLSLAYLFIGFALISQHPLSLFFGFTMALLCYHYMIKEEKMTIEKYGEEYVQYMKKVPRSNLLLGLWRVLRRKSM
ncbi:MAG: methyltransferase family protein [Promethearchaeota archaeon]